MKTSRRTLISGGVAAAAASGLVAAVRAAREYGLIPPDSSGIYGPGETLNYAAEKLLARHASAREFPPSEISKLPFAKGAVPLPEEFTRLQAGGFAGWRLEIDGMVARPGSMSLAEIRRYPSHRQTTMLACEEGWSYIAEWTGTPLSTILEAASAHPQARYVVYYSIQKGRWDSIDIDEAMHPQTVVAYSMNGADLPVAHGGPLRMRVPRQLGYKNLKFLARLTVTDRIKDFGQGRGSRSAERGYAWYAGV